MALFWFGLVGDMRLRSQHTHALALLRALKSWPHFVSLLCLLTAFLNASLIMVQERLQLGTQARGKTWPLGYSLSAASAARDTRSPDPMAHLSPCL